MNRPWLISLAIYCAWNLCVGQAAPASDRELAGHQLLVTSVRTGDTEVFLADPATGDLTNLTRSPTTEDRYPCWSPDGQRFAFTRDAGDNAKHLWIGSIAEKTTRPLVRQSAAAYMPSWQKTPDGERIVFGLHGTEPMMASIDPEGERLQLLGVGHDPTLSPDGMQIVYTGHVDGGVSVFTMNWRGEQKVRIVTGISPVGATFPNWSPDSQQIVYSFPVGNALELFLVQRDGTNARQLTHFGGTSVCTPSAWSPDGNWIAFRKTDERYWSDPERMKAVYAQKPADKRPVWRIRPDGTDAHVIECLRYQMAIDGSRAAWRPLAASNK